MNNKNRGFTLIEVMIALAIVAMALPAFMTLVSSQLRGSGFIREKTQAYWIAEDQLTRLNLRHKLIDQLVLPDTENGVVEVSGVEWFWEINSQDTEVENFKRIDIRVSLNSEKENTLALLSGFMNE